MNKLLAECIGTLFLCLSVLLTGNPLAIAVTLVIMIYSLGYISGAHFNPAVSIAVWLRGKMEKPEMFRYFGAQFAGALLAVVLARLLVTPPDGAAAAEFPSIWRAILAEVVFTFFLAFTVLHVATAKEQTNNQYYGAAIGLCVFAGATAVGTISGAAFNPAVGLAVVAGGAVTWSMLFVYIAACAAGGALAAIVFRVLNPND